MKTVAPQEARDILLAEECAKARKLQIIFGRWWRYYATPYEFRWTLYFEETSCPYCGAARDPSIDDRSDADGGLWAEHLDHMDPLSRGGEGSIRNAVYLCGRCNLAKGKQLFVAWRDTLVPELRERAQNIYEAKHGHLPEAFRPGPRQARLIQPRRELRFDESVLRRLFPTPIVTGPPGTTPVTTEFTPTRQSPR